MPRFVRLPENEAHVARHGLTPAACEAVFRARDVRGPEPIPELPHRFFVSGTVRGALVQLVIAKTGPDEIFVITGYRTSPRRRKP